MFAKGCELACECKPGDYQLGQDMVFFRANKGGLLQVHTDHHPMAPKPRAYTHPLAQGTAHLTAHASPWCFVRS